MLALKRRLGVAPQKVPRVGKWVIEPTRVGLVARVEEFWRYRRMFWFFCVRMVRALYEKFTLGIFWLFFRPVFPILITAIVFGGLLKVPSDGVPYFLFLLVGMTIWHLFEFSALWVTRSLDKQKGLITKVYFPRLMVPFSAVSPGVVHFLIYVALIVVACFYYLYKDGVWYLHFGVGLLASVLVVVMSVVFAAAIGLFTCVWQVRHREVRYAMRQVLRFWQYLTPVLYPMSLVPAEHRWLVYLNPMAPYVETFKWGVLGRGAFPGGPLLAAAGITVGALAAGVWYFNRLEASSVDHM